MKRRRSAAIALLVVAAASCADDTGGGSAPSSPSHGTAPSDLLLRWGYEGGFTPPEFQLTNLPTFSLYGDGTIVRPGPQIEIYPAPALPAIESLKVDEDAIEAILDAAFDAELDTVGDLTDMGSVGIADAPESVFTLQARGVDRTVRVYALNEMSGRPPGMPAEEYEARQHLIDLVNDLGSLESWLPEGSVSAGGVYEPSGTRAFVSRYRGGQAELHQPEISWPLATPLRGVDDGSDADIPCVLVTGVEWTEQLLPAAQTANQLTPWVSEGRRFAVAFRPLLPDETTC